MADGERSALGLSVGATNLAAVTADRAITRKPVLTLFQQRSPEVGVPSENPRLNEPGLVITDFVDRVGDPAGIVASDGSTHRSETLVADGLRALAYTATDGWALPAAVAVSYPAHWQSRAVDALQVALSRLSEWSGSRPSLLPDFAATMTALQSNPGIPSRGIIAVCDFGGSGTSLTLVDAARGGKPVAPTVRHAEFSGNLIDQVLLTHVLAELSSAGSFDASATSAIGSLNQLRVACRHVKEELSSTTVATLIADVPGFHGDIRITRTEFDDAIRPSLDRFCAFVRETLQRNGIRSADLVAAASVGGGASTPAVTTMLSQHLRVPVITTPRPHMTAAIGAALGAACGAADNGETALAPTAAGVGSLASTAKIEAVPESNLAPPLAWSEVAADGNDSDIGPIRTGEYPEPGSNAAVPSARPQPTFDRDSRPNNSTPAADAWYRRPAVLIVGTALVVLAIGAAIMIALRHISGSAPGTPAPNVSTTPSSSAPAGQSPAPSDATDTQAPANSPPTSTESDTMAPPSTTTQSVTTTTQAPTTTTSVPTTTTPVPTTTQVPEPPVVPPIPRIPGLPRFLPQPEPGNR